jgi:hypothetical protein
LSGRSASQERGSDDRKSKGLGGKISFWKRRTANITEYDPTYRVVYLGNVLTGWAKGKSIRSHSNNEYEVLTEKTSPVCFEAAGRASLTLALVVMYPHGSQRFPNYCVGIMKPGDTIIWTW